MDTRRETTNKATEQSFLHIRDFEEDYVVTRVNYEKLGAYIQGLRERAGLTEKEIASLLYMSTNTYMKYETGFSKLDEALYNKILKIIKNSCNF